MILFLVGILEMVISTTWTRVVTRAKVVSGGVVTMVNVLIWYYVLQTIIDDISNWQLVLLYSFGCALGTVISMLFFEWLDKRQATLEAGTE